MSDNKGYIELDGGAEVTIVNPKTKRSMYTIIDRNKHCSMSYKREDIEEYCSLKKVDYQLFGCLLAMEYIENNSMNINISDKIRKQIQEVHNYFQDLLENNPIKGKDSDQYVIKEQFYQSVTIYEKEKNPFMDSSQNI